MEECLTTPDSLKKSETPSLEHFATMKRALEVALKILQILEARKNPEDHPVYLALKDELESLKEELKK